MMSRHGILYDGCIRNTHVEYLMVGELGICMWSSA